MLRVEPRKAGARALRRTFLTLSIAIGALALLALAWTALGPRAARRHARTQILARLQAPDPQTRKQAAWDAPRLGDPELDLFLAQQLTSGEADEGVREAYAYALGHVAGAHSRGALELAIDLDDSGYVRAAAWLALARTSAERFASVATRHADRDSLWDRLGIAQGRLWLGDTSAAETVFESALRGDELQRWVATRAIQRSIRPLLDAAGRWPLAQTADDWPPEAVARVRGAAQELDLAALAADSRAHIEAAQSVRQAARKYSSASARIAGWLF